MSAEDTEVAPDAVRPPLGTDDTLAAPDVADMLQAPGPSGARGETSAPLRAPEALRKGSAVGRYVVLERLGAGGMGEVFAAYDPELDRKVALKLLRFDRARGAEEQDRLLAEAQALAKLNHPNVVAVHDVGEHEGQVYLAMEFVEGQTLQAWADEERRGWREVLEVFERAADGLRAAHALGMVHRDFKPENVMVGVDGRVRVMDFGLARATPALASPTEDAKRALETATTRADHIMGTPAFMAPEQFETAQVTAAADQFAFCVSAWRILYGRSPFGGTTMAERVYAMQQEGLLAPPVERRVPRWLRRVLERGLSLEPSKRWESMDGLVAAIRRGRRSWIRVLAGAAALAAVGVGAGYSLDQRAAVQGCEAQAREATEMWAEHHDALRLAMGDDARGPTGDALERVEGYVERWADAWGQASNAACRRHRVTGEWSSDRYESTASCLEHDLFSVDLRLELMMELDPSVVSGNAVGFAASLEEPGRCLEQSYLASRQWPAPQRWETLRPLERRHQRIVSQVEFERVEAALEPARALVRDVEESGDERLLSDVLQTLGWIEQNLGMYDEAVSDLERSYWMALSAGLDSLAITPAITLSFVFGSELGRVDVAEIWAGQAAAHLDAVKRTGYVPPGLELGVLKARARVEGQASDFDAALATLDEALALSDSALGAASLSQKDLLAEKAGVLGDAGRYEESVEVLGEVLSELETLYGPSHASVASALSNRALAYYGLGDLEEARSDQERAIEINLAQYGENSPNLFGDLNNMAVFFEADGDALGALAVYDRCLELEGLSPQTLVRTQRNRAMTLADLERHEEANIGLAQAEQTTDAMGSEPSPDRFLQSHAEAYVALRAGEFERALLAGRTSEALAAEVYGQEHDLYGVALRSVALALLGRGELDEAQAVATRARGVWIEAKHPRVGWGPLLLGKIALARDDYEAAKDHLELAVELMASRERPANELAEAELELARALRGLGDERRAAETALAASDRLSRVSGAVALRRDLEAFVGADEN